MATAVVTAPPRRAERREAAHALRARRLDLPRGLGLAATALTLFLGAWRLGRPALWLDEAASVLATQRTWPDLWNLTRGADAPLVPYYALLKVVSGAVQGLFPGAPPELVYRWPSVVAAALAAGVLVTCLARRGGAPLAAATTAMFLLTGGVSRYAQEARPYAFVLLGAVLATYAWCRLAETGSRRWVPLYGLAVAFMVVMHSLSATLVVAHVVATLVALPPGHRRRSAALTAAGGAVGVAVVLPLVVLGMQHGEGATRFLPLSAPNLVRVFVEIFTTGNGAQFGLGAVLLLAAAGLVRAVLRLRHDDYVARVLLLWAVLPPALLLPAVVLRNNLLIGRYLLFTVPAWAALAGFGLVGLTELARRAATEAARQLAAGPRLRHGIGPAAAVATAAVLVGVTAAAQLPTLKLVRTTFGHTEDIRPALDAANSPAYAGLPIVTNSRLGAITIAAYDRADEPRLVGAVIQRSGPSIWPDADPLGARIQLLRLHPQVVLLLRGSSEPGCRLSGGRPAPTEVESCLSPLLRRMGYHVVATAEGGRVWAFALLDRTPGVEQAP